MIFCATVISIRGYFSCYLLGSFSLQKNTFGKVKGNICEAEAVIMNMCG